MVSFPVLVTLGRADRLQVRGDRVARGHHQAPPPRNKVADTGQMLFGSDHPRELEHAVIGFDLALQARQSVVAGLDFESLQSTIDESDVSTSGAIGQQKLVHHHVAFATTRCQMLL